MSHVRSSDGDVLRIATRERYAGEPSQPSESHPLGGIPCQLSRSLSLLSFPLSLSLSSLETSGTPSSPPPSCFSHFLPPFRFHTHASSAGSSSFNHFLRFSCAAEALLLIFAFRLFRPPRLPFPSSFSSTCLLGFLSSFRRSVCAPILLFSCLQVLFYYQFYFLSFLRVYFFRFYPLYNVYSAFLLLCCLC